MFSFRKPHKQLPSFKMATSPLVLNEMEAQAAFIKDGNILYSTSLHNATLSLDSTSFTIFPEGILVPLLASSPGHTIF